MKITVLNGMAYVDDERIPCNFENGILKLYFDQIKDGFIRTEDERFICIQKRENYSGIDCLMHTPTPLSCYYRISDAHVSYHNIDWLIDSFNNEARYCEMCFNFDELNYFMPAWSQVNVDGDNYVFSNKPKEQLSFDMKVGDINTRVQLLHCFKAKLGVSVTASVCAELRITFEPCNDYDFFYKLFLIVSDTFSFLFNRRNIKLDSAGLYEDFVSKGPSATLSTLYVFNKFKEPTEDNIYISQTIHLKEIESHFGELMQLIANNYYYEGGTISLAGIHPSFLKRNIFDLKQSMSITSSFEHHVRRYMPNIYSEQTNEVYSEIKALIENSYILSAKGRKRKIAKSIVKNLLPMISLEEKIKKAIKGYSGWNPLLPIIEDKFKNWENLASNASKWRNELAHEKREVVITWDVVKSVRLIEHLNYAIILRESGYNDDEIKVMLDRILSL